MENNLLHFSKRCGPDKNKWNESTLMHFYPLKTSTAAKTNCDRDTGWFWLNFSKPQTHTHTHLNSDLAKEPESSVWHFIRHPEVATGQECVCAPVDKMARLDWVPRAKHLADTWWAVKHRCPNATETQQWLGRARSQKVAWTGKRKVGLQRNRSAFWTFRSHAVVIKS